MPARLAAPRIRLVDDTAQLPGVREALQWFTREKQWINERHLELCRVPAPTFLEHRRAEWMAGQLRGLGWQTQIDRAGNVIALSEPSSRRPLVALTAHLDTVIAPKSPEEILVESDGRFRGPGVADNGAGLAALLAVAKALKSGPAIEGRAFDPVLIANVGEEGEGNLSGMRHICRQSPLGKRIASFLVLDGANTDHITMQALASRRFEVTFTGPGGHSWSDYGVVNPVHALGRVVAALADIPLNGAPRSTLNVGLIEGGTGVNAIPTTASAKVDIRSESDSKIEELVGRLEEAVEDAKARENARATSGKVVTQLTEIGSRPAGQLSKDAAILRYIKAVDGHLGIRAHPDCASTDANIPLSMGVPAVSIGAGGQGGGAHSPHEWFLPDGRDLALKRILLTLTLLMLDSSLAAGHG